MARGRPRRRRRRHGRDAEGAKTLLREMAEAAHVCGDPGMQYDTTINRWNPVKTSGRINSSNPCSEYMFLDDTACNLASLNLMRFLGDDGEFRTSKISAARWRSPSWRRRSWWITRTTRPPDRAQQPPLPPARPWLREPGRAAHEPRASLRQRRRAQPLRRHHLAHVRPGLLRKARAIAAAWAPSRTTAKPQALPRGDCAHERPPAPCRKTACRPRSGTRSAKHVGGALELGERHGFKNARSPCSRPPAPSAS